MNIPEKVTKYQGLTTRLAAVRAEISKLQEVERNLARDIQAMLPTCRDCKGNGRSSYYNDEYETTNTKNCESCGGTGKLKDPVLELFSDLEVARAKVAELEQRAAKVSP